MNGKTDEEILAEELIETLWNVNFSMHIIVPGRQF